MTELALRMTLLARVLRRARRPWTRYQQRKALDRAAGLVGRVLAHLARAGQPGLAGTDLRVTRTLLTRSDVAVALVARGADIQPTLALKLPLTPDAVQSTLEHRKIVMALHQMPGLREFCAVVPQPVAWGDFEGQPYYVETALPGVSANELVVFQGDLAPLKHEAARRILDLHAATLRRQTIDEAAFARLAGDDLALIEQLAAQWPGASALRAKLRAVGAALREQLIGRELPLAWGHGDYWPGNFLVSDTGALSGVIDWDRAGPDQLPLNDLLHLVGYTRKMQRHTDLGEEIVGYLLPAAFDQDDRALLDQAVARLGLPADAEFLRAATLLYWLRFAASNLRRYPAFRRDGRWLGKNIFVVLKRGV